MVSKIWFKEGEIDPAGQPVISFRSSEMKIQADVPEEDILKVAIGSAARVKFKALVQTVFFGKVDAIEAHEINKDGDVYYRVDIGSSDFNPPLRSGMTADVFIDSAEQDSAIKIPSSYVSWRAGRSYVTVVNAGKRQEVEVETGATDGDSTEISSGLQEGQQLLSP